MTDQPHLFTPPKVFNEREFQSILQEGLTREGWNWNHTYRMRTSSGAWRTSTTAVGFPDLLAIRPPHILALEVKADKGRMGPEQVEWLARFAALPTGLAWVLRPRDNWQHVANWLHNPWKAPTIHGWEAPPDDSVAPT